MKTVRKYCMLFFLLSVSLQNIAQAKTTEEFPKWTVNFSLGLGLGPSKNSFANFGLPSSAISSFHTNIPWSLELNRTLNKILASNISVEKIGYKGTFFDIQHNLKIVGVSPGVKYTFKNMFVFGAGPTIYVIKQKPHYTSQSKSKYQSSKFGFEIKSAINFADGKILFGQFNVKYCFIGKVENFEFADMDAPQQRQFIYYPKVNMSHIYIGLTLGFKIK